MSAPSDLHQEPRLVVSHDGAWVVALEGERCRLFSLRPGRAAGGLAVQGAQRLEAALLGDEPLLLLLAVREDGSRLSVCQVPSLRETCRTDLPFAATIAAVAGDLCLLLGAGQPQVLSASERKVQLAPLPVRGPVQLAAPLADARVLIVVQGRCEVWDMATRRPLFRLHLELSPLPHSIGVGSAGRVLWTWSSSRRSLDVVKLASGQHAQLDLGVPAVWLDGLPEVDWLAAALPLPDGTVQLHQIDLLRSTQQLVGPPLSADVFALLGGASPALLHASPGEPPRLLPFGAGDPVPGASPPELAPEPRPPETAGTPGTPGPPGSTTTGTLEERLAAVRRQSGEFAASHPVASTIPVRADVRGPLETWRDELVSWASNEAMRVRDVKPPPWEPESPMAVLSELFHLDVPARAVVGLLYARWLLGEAQTGVPAHRLARVGGWAEALGRGVLAREGIAFAEDGRVRLARTVGRFLDGRPPGLVALFKEAPRGGLRTAPGRATLVVLAPDETPEDAARRLSQQLGPVALLDGRRGTQRTASGLLEARLHQALPLLLPRRDAASELPAGVVLVAAAEPLSAELDALPRWRLDEDADEDAGEDADEDADDGADGRAAR